ncbi:DNA repair protein XRCC1 isoform X2 [Hetaerina americana]|uniref:DNA repair protein XRCC1 isoform X2 n=1 Tax=Hetaerina americana TaxID=62018 RepID=UPI003A7F2F6F
MPKVKVSHIVSFSSEDLKFPASNLLRSENYRKWKCKDPGEKEGSVILQLEKAENITSIDIGNESSAFVEILVGRSSQPSEDFKVLLLTSSFMTPMESRNMTNTNRVRMFASDKLDKAVQKEKWDRIKVVCTQPYNKHMQYGLSFITFHSDSGQEGDEPKPKLLFGGFSLKEDKKEDDFKAGSLFAGYKDKHSVGILKGAAAIREASTSEGLSVSKAQSETKALLKEIEKRKKTESDIDPVAHRKHIGFNSSKKRDTAAGETDSSEQTSSMRHEGTVKTVPNNNNDNNRNSQCSENQSDKRQRSPQSLDSSSKKVKTEMVNSRKPKRKPFNQLLEGVVFVMSGFQNPLRGELRSKALEMGAKYKPDWNDSCTHLVCAFPNTPKFMQVLGKGHIVNSHWIEDGYSKRQRLPWRRYAMAKHEKGKEESEEEILEETGDNFSDAGQGAPSGSDTDDEINRCLSGSVAVDASIDIRPSSGRSECYNCETEDENEDSKSDEITKNGKFSVPHFPDFFGGYVFYIHPKVDSETRYELIRHIIAYKGKFVDIFTEEVTHVLVDEDLAKIVQLPIGIRDTNVVATRWIWDCHDSEKLIPLDSYLLQ